MATFIKYQGQLASLGSEVLSAQLNRKSNSEVAEFIRQNFIQSMTRGWNLCFDCETSVPEWASYEEAGTFSPEHFFDWEFMNNQANYLPYVREEEQQPGNTLPRNDSFQMIIRAGCET